MALGVRFILRLRPAGPPWLSYQTDVFLEIRWRWAYTAAHRIADMTPTPFCSQCACRMVVGNTSGYRGVPRTAFKCEECGFAREFEDPGSETAGRVQRLIEQAINPGAWSTRTGSGLRSPLGG